MAMNDYLPQQIIFKILSLLPVLSLLQCKSVCKSWLSIITDPHFIQTHLNISLTKHPSLLNIPLLLAFGAVLEDQQEAWLVYLYFGEYSFCIKLPPLFKDMIQFIGYCNGLVCLGDFDNEGICVWNPSIKRFKMLPTPNKKTTRSPVKLGFGYDSVSDDYKFVRILVSSVSHEVEAELYSVNEDCWKDIELPKAVQRAWLLMNFIRVHAINAVLYLVGHDVLVLFHLHNEVFEVYPYPDAVKGKEKFTFFDFGGCVAMIFKTVVGGDSVYSLWTLDNVCGKVGWTKKFNLEPDLQMDRVDLYLGDGQFVARDYHVGFFVYDLMKKETKRLHFPIDDGMIISPVKYTESLVSLNGFEEVSINYSSNGEIMHNVASSQ